MGREEEWTGRAQRGGQHADREGTGPTFALAREGSAIEAVGREGKGTMGRATRR